MAEFVTNLGAQVQPALQSAVNAARLVPNESRLELVGRHLLALARGDRPPDMCRTPRHPTRSELDALAEMLTQSLNAVHNQWRSQISLVDALRFMANEMLKRAAPSQLDFPTLRAAALDEAEAAVLARAERRCMPARLVLGLTIGEMQAMVDDLPADIVAQCNEACRGRYPPNEDLNGYVNQWAASRRQTGMSLAEDAVAHGRIAPRVATVFVSWPLIAPIAHLMEALTRYVHEHPEEGLSVEHTRFWVCDFVIRQEAMSQVVGSPLDEIYLNDCVEVIARTVLLCEPWHDPLPLRRTYCLKEILSTELCGAPLHILFTEAQASLFDEAIIEDPHAIETSLQKIDARNSECRDPQETKRLLAELEARCASDQINVHVTRLMRASLVKRSKTVLTRRRSLAGAPGRKTKLQAAISIASNVADAEHSAKLDVQTVMKEGARFEKTVLAATNLQRIGRGWMARAKVSRQTVRM